MPSELTRIRDEIETLIEDDHDDPAALAAVIADRVVVPLLAARDDEVERLRAELANVQRGADTWKDAADGWEERAERLTIERDEQRQRAEQAEKRLTLAHTARQDAEERLTRCVEVLIADGYFQTTDEVGADVAPRIAERLTAAREAEAERDAAYAAIAAVAEAVNVARRIMACSSRDWSLHPDDVWLYAILVGWECELPEHAGGGHDEIDCDGPDGLDRFAERFGWTEGGIVKLRAQRVAIAALDASTAPESRPANSKEILSGSGSAPESPQEDRA